MSWYPACLWQIKQGCKKDYEFVICYIPQGSKVSWVENYDGV